MTSTAPYSYSGENSVSPVTGLTSSLHILSSIKYEQNPRRRLSLGSRTPTSPAILLSPLKVSMSGDTMAVSVTGDEFSVLSNSETISPFLYARLKPRTISLSPLHHHVITSSGLSDSLQSVAEEGVREGLLVDFDNFQAKITSSELPSRILSHVNRRNDIKSASSSALVHRSATLDKENISCSHTSPMKQSRRCSGSKVLCTLSIDALLSSPIFSSTRKSDDEVSNASLHRNILNRESGSSRRSSGLHSSVQSGCTPKIRRWSVRDHDADPSEPSSPMAKKRRSTTADCCDSPSEGWPMTSPVLSLRHHSVATRVKSSPCAEFSIKSALSRADSQLQDLVGDFTASYCLPTVRSSKHCDLKSISSHTLSRVLNGDYDDVVARCIIVDCRYPYEYSAGHIQDAVNIYSKEEIFERFVKSVEFSQLSASSSCRLLVIFHCEFSSERGPRLMRFLRNKDREIHRDQYPSLYYPEMYLLDGGYKAFFESYRDLCVPRCYKPMVCDGHTDDLRHFRAKSKSWTGEGNQKMSAIRKLTLRASTD